MTLTAMIAEAVCEAVEQACQLRPQIKWANDLLFQKRKSAAFSRSSPWKPRAAWCSTPWSASA